MKKIYIPVLTISILILISCDPYYPRDMLINDSEKVTINFGNNNKMEIRATNWGGWILDYHKSIFYIYMIYDIKDLVIIHKDLIRIEYNGKFIKWPSLMDIPSDRKERDFENDNFDSFIKWDLEETVMKANYVLKGKGQLALPFSINDEIEVKEGDKIKITAPHFISCKGGPVSLNLTLEIGKFY